MKRLFFTAIIVMLFAALGASAQMPEKPMICPGQSGGQDITALKSAVEKAAADVKTIQSISDKAVCFRTSPLARNLAGLIGKRPLRGVTGYHYYQVTNAGNYFSVDQIGFKAEAGAANAERLLKKAGGTFRSPGLTQYKMIRKGNLLLLFVYSSRALTPENSALIDAITKNYETI